MAEGGESTIGCIHHRRAAAIGHVGTRRQGPDEFALRRIPQTERAGVERDNRLAVRCIGDGSHRALVSRTRVNFRAVGGVPLTDQAIAACRSQGLAVGREGHRSHTPLIRLPRADFLACADRPEPDGVVPSGRGQRFAIGRKRETTDAGVHGIPQFADFLARDRVPEADRLVFTRRSQGLAVRRERDRPDVLFGMTINHVDFLARCRRSTCGSSLPGPMKPGSCRRARI